eukprot:561030-Amphidinium_carterae.1
MVGSVGVGVGATYDGERTSRLLWIHEFQTSKSIPHRPHVQTTHKSLHVSANEVNTKKHEVTEQSK